MSEQTSARPGRGTAAGPGDPAGKYGMPPEPGSRPAAAPGEPADDEDALSVIPLRHPRRWLGTAVVLVLIAMLVHTALTNSNFQWNVVFQYFMSESVLIGLLKTLELTVLSMTAGILLGLLLAMMRLSSTPILKSVAAWYVWVFRGTPLLVQVVVLYNISALYPKLSIGIPFGPGLGPIAVDKLVTPMLVAVVALGSNEGAFMSEIIRGGILSVDHGQIEAAESIGMSPWQTYRRIVLPQAMRFIVPPTGNQVIALLKATSLVSIIAFPEILYSVQAVYSRTYQIIPLLLVATIWYLIVTSVLMVGQRFIEQHYGRGSQRSNRTARAGAPLGRAVGRMLLPRGVTR